MKFLIVDDMEENLLALEGLLRRDELQILKARSGSEALELLLENEFALAILDVQMPGMTGFELAEIMRGSLRTRHIPIIFLTAGSLNDQWKFRGYEAGAVDFLFKPIEPAVMQGKAEVFFDLYCQRQEVIRQRDQLQLAAEENARLFQEILALNEGLEERVHERTAQLLETNEQLKGFTNSIAHDFRQHIRNINQNAHILLAEVGDRLGESNANVERIQQVAKLMNQMTDDLLTYARMRTLTVKAVEIDISALAREVAELASANYPASRYKVEDGIVMCGDRTMFRLVLENLVDNAFKYSQHAESPLIEVGKEESGFFVRDNGVGVDMDYVDKLFKPFERLLSESEYVGTGMGLANVKRILDRHGGRVWVTSGLGEGTMFHVNL